MDGSQINTTISSHAIKTEAVKQLRVRPEDINRLRYTLYIGDEDSRGYIAVPSMKPYGEAQGRHRLCSQMAREEPK